MTEALFYHLTQRPLESALPELLEKTLARGWRAVVRGRDVERIEALSEMLWTYRDDSFLPHGTARDGEPASHPVFLTDTDTLPNDPQILFLVDGAPAPDWRAFERVCVLFDDRDAQAVSLAREQWREATGAGIPATYWSQTEAGGWRKAAESGR